MLVGRGPFAGGVAWLVCDLGGQDRVLQPLQWTSIWLVLVSEGFCGRSVGRAELQ